LLVTELLEEFHDSVIFIPAAAKSVIRSANGVKFGAEFGLSIVTFWIFDVEHGSVFLFVVWGAVLPPVLLYHRFGGMQVIIFGKSNNLAALNLFENSLSLFWSFTVT
jgi:hypothetical protein